METNVEELLIDLSERIRREYGFRDEKSRAGGVGSSEWYRVDMLKVDGETFQQMLARLLREKGMTGPEVYKKVGIDRRTWAKIASVKHNCTPEKRTVLAAALGMRLDLAGGDIRFRSFSPHGQGDSVLERGQLLELRVYEAVARRGGES